MLVRPAVAEFILAYQKQIFIKGEETMKRIIISAVALLMLLVSIGGCFVPWDRDGRGGGPDRDGGHDRGGHEERR
jgi:hypothetical protein